MSLWAALGYLLISAALSAALTPLAIAYSRSKGLIDQPDPRRSHTQPVPRGGGVGMVVVLLAGICASCVF